jgi:hypothetical protein
VFETIDELGICVPDDIIFFDDTSSDFINLTNLKIPNMIFTISSWVYLKDRPNGTPADSP